MKKIAATLLLSAVSALGQANRVAVPTLGFVPGASGGGVQPIVGIAGAARLGHEIPISGVNGIAIAPGGRYLLAEQDGAISVALLGNAAQDQLSFTPVSGTLAQSAKVVFSPSGSSAAIYSPGLNTVQVLTGLPGIAHVASKFDTASTLGRIAVSDDGQMLLAHEAGGKLLDLSSGETLLNSGSVAAIAFNTGSHSGYVLDPGTDALLAFTGDSVSKLSLSDSSAVGAQCLTTTSDGANVLLGSPASHNLWVVNSTNGKVKPYPLEDGVKAFTSLGVKDTFLLQYAGGSYGVATWRNGRLSISFVGVVRDGGVQ